MASIVHTYKNFLIGGSPRIAGVFEDWKFEVNFSLDSVVEEF